MQLWLHTLTDFGDAAVLIPLAAAILVWLLFNNLRSATWWSVAVALCVGLTAVLKIDFYGCPPISDLHSPSGHTGFSVLVYGAIALLGAAQSSGAKRILAVVSGIGFISAIAASRLLLRLHSLPEIGLGLVIGIATLSLFGRVYRPLPHGPIWPLLVIVAVLLAMLHGQELRAEELLHRISGYFGINCT